MCKLLRLQKASEGSKEEREGMRRRKGIMRPLGLLALLVFSSLLKPS
jgi:hypothetical protein